MDDDIAGESSSSHSVAGDAHPRVMPVVPRVHSFLCLLIRSTSGWWTAECEEAGWRTPPVFEVSEDSDMYDEGTFGVCMLAQVSARLVAHDHEWSCQRQSTMAKWARKAVRGRVCGYIVYDVEKFETFPNFGVDEDLAGSADALWHEFQEGVTDEGAVVEDIAREWVSDQGRAWRRPTAIIVAPHIICNVSA